MKDLLLAVWAYRHFIVSSIRNDLRSRFVRSKLGALWMILQPLAQSAIYALILSKVLAARLPGVDSAYAYPIYLMSGMLAWSLFSELLSRSMTMFVDNAAIMKKIMFPRICLPIIVTGSALVNNVLLLAAVLVVFALMGNWPSAAMLWLPLLTLVNLAFGMALGMLCGVLNVFVRDVGQVVGVILQLWFWLTPVVYMVDIIPESMQAWVKANPMYPIVTGYQDAMLYGRAPDLHSLLVVGSVSVLLLVFAFLLFRRAAADMVDVL
ncbi:MAG: ABC transporter permease [Pseudoxanthomonas sp.]